MTNSLAIAQVTLRDSLIGMISDDSKAVNGCRLRLNWADYSIAELTAMHEYYYGKLLIALKDDRFEGHDHWSQCDAWEKADQEAFEAEWALWEQIKPTKWDAIADRLEGIPF